MRAGEGEERGERGRRRAREGGEGGEHEMGGGRERDCAQGRASKGRERVEESERGQRGRRARDAEGAEGSAQERRGRGRERGWREAREWENEWGVMSCLSLRVSDCPHSTERADSSAICFSLSPALPPLIFADLHLFLHQNNDRPTRAEKKTRRRTFLSDEACQSFIRRW